MVETYGYDSQNRLTSYTDGATTATYAYDALDRRIASTVDGVTTAFVYDPWSVSGSTSNDILLDFEDGVQTKRWLHGPRVDEPLAFEGYAGTTAAGSGSAYEMFAGRMGSVT